MSNRIEDSNAVRWSRANVAFRYRDKSELFPAEIALMKTLHDRLTGSEALDIGVGTGRTTSHIAPLCSRYVGVDYSQAMIDRAKSRFPGLDLRLADARDLKEFADASFDLVFFSYNGIDYVGHSDRLRIFSEARRVLRSGGIFAFSTHRLGTPVATASAWSNLRPSANVLRSALGVLLYVQGIRNSRAMKPKEEHHSGYALLNDSAHQYSLLTYYVTPDEQLRQLQRSGFAAMAAFDCDGREIRPDMMASHAFSDDDYMVHYIAEAR